MRLLLHSASIEEIRAAAEQGACDGVVTDPVTIAGEGKDYRYAIREAARAFSGPVAAQVLAGDDEAAIYRESKELARIADNVVIRIPFGRAGLRATSRLTAENVRVDVTLCFSPAQALLAARAGATFVSAFVGRLDELGAVGMDLVRDVVAIYDNYELPTQILAGPVRHPNHVIEAALAGADGAILPFAVLDALFDHPLTDEGVRTGREEWEKVASGLPIKKVIRGERES